MLGEYIFEKESSPLTLPGDVDTVSDNPILIKKDKMRVKGKSPTHRKNNDEEDIAE